MNLRFISWFTSFLVLLFCSLYASGGYDNGTAIGKGNIGIDLTWNPFNYWEQGQSYAVISYGINQKLDIHGYYSIPVKGSENYYIGGFYQFFNHRYLDLATAIGIRSYLSNSEKHIFFPQLLYTIYMVNNLKLGGSIVNIREINENYNIIGTTADIALIIPLYNSKKINGIIESIDFTIGAFRPILWKPIRGLWHPTYSFDFKFFSSCNFNSPF